MVRTGDPLYRRFDSGGGGGGGGGCKIPRLPSCGCRRLTAREVSRVCLQQIEMSQPDSKKLTRQSASLSIPT